jgi:hypothetical protein
MSTMSQPPQRPIVATARMLAAAASLVALGMGASTAQAGGPSSPYPVITLANAYVYTEEPSCCVSEPVGTFSGTGYSVTSAASGTEISITASTYIYQNANLMYVGNAGFSDFVYYYAVLGPADTYLPVTITGSISAGGTLDATSQATLNWANGGTDTENYGAGAVSKTGSVCSACEPAYDLPVVNYAVSQTYDVLSNTQLAIYLYVLPQVSSGGQQLSATAFATIDPMLTLTPTEIADGYSIELSPNITPAPPALPETSTWAMLLIGLGGLGAMSRWSRRDRQSRLAALI